MQRIKRVVVVVTGAGLLVIGALAGGPDLNDSYNDNRGGFVTASGDPRPAGAIGVSGDGIDQDDAIGATGGIRANGDGSDHSWSVAGTTSEQFAPGVPNSESGPLFGVQFS
jgi:hypothetical protein